MTGIAFLQPYRDRLASVCQQNGVTRLYVFGSVTTADFNVQRSDIDLLVELPEELAPEQKGELYFKLLADFEHLFNRKIDLLMNQSFRNPYFARAVERSKQLVYAA